MSETYTFREFREYVQDRTANPYSDEGQEVIHKDGETHVAEIWEDGEITATKCGELYGARSLHQMSPPLLPEGYELFDVPDDHDHQRMVILDEELRETIKNATVNVSTTGIEVVVDAE